MKIKGSVINVPDSVKSLDPEYSGLIAISDIDKTYLATQIESIGGLLKTAFETAESKDNIPGFSTVLRAVRRGGGNVALKNPIFFVSASPPQMREVLQAKMQLDGVQHNGIIFKDQLTHVRNRDFKKLREQVGYKLEALFALWAELPKRSKLLLFGDDSESDPIIYSLFCDALSGAARGQKLDSLLAGLGVFPTEKARILSLVDGFGEREFRPVELIFVNVVSGSNPSYYNRYGPLMFATENSLQVALTLFENGLIRERAVKSIGRELVLYYDYNPQRLLESLRAGALRGLYGMETLRRLWMTLATDRIIPEPSEGELDSAQATSMTRISRNRWYEMNAQATLTDLRNRYVGLDRYSR